MKDVKENGDIKYDKECFIKGHKYCNVAALSFFMLIRNIEIL